MNSQESKKLEKVLLKKLKTHLSENDTVVAGISGGPDSTFLLYLLKKLPIKIIVAHVNHSLRKESDEEEEFVKKNTLSKNGNDHIFLSTKRNISELAKKNKKGLEETGRKIRYDFFKKSAGKYDAKYILTAHHADDNLETIISNFVRGANIRGLSGMKEKFEDFTPPLLRPLLSVSKKQIVSFLKFNKINFKTDKTNRNIKFKRNFIRHEVIPVLEKMNPSLTETVSKNATELKKIDEYLTESAQKWLKKNTISKNKVDAKSFRLQNESIKKTILMELHEKVTGHTLNIGNIHLKEVIDMIDKNIGNKRKKLGQLVIEIEKNTIRLKNQKKKYTI